MLEKILEPDFETAVLFGMQILLATNIFTVISLWLNIRSNTKLIKLLGGDNVRREADE